MNLQVVAPGQRAASSISKNRQPRQRPPDPRANPRLQRQCRVLSAKGRGDRVPFGLDKIDLLRPVTWPRASPTACHDPVAWIPGLYDKAGVLTLLWPPAVLPGAAVFFFVW